MSIKHPLDSAPRAGNEFATLGGGCFWCLEAVYEELEGVIDVESGCAGGPLRQPSYRAVCGGDTGHAEVVRIEFDPARLPYREVLEVFFAIHDPTTRNRQGNDIGSQYRSVIVHHSEAQRQMAAEVIDEAQSHDEQPIVTEQLTAADPASAYWRAEAEHQEYFRHHPEQGYCMFIVAPKVAKFRKTFAGKRRKTARD